MQSPHHNSISSWLSAKCCHLFYRVGFNYTQLPRFTGRSIYTAAAAVARRPGGSATGNRCRRPGQQVSSLHPPKSDSRLLTPSSAWRFSTSFMQIVSGNSFKARPVKEDENECCCNRKPKLLPGVQSLYSP